MNCLLEEFFVALKAPDFEIMPSIYSYLESKSLYTKLQTWINNLGPT